MKKQQNRTAIKKEAVLKALEKHLGVVAPAMRAAKISRTTFYKWIDSDDDFSSKVDEIKEMSIDFVESQMFKQVRAGNTALIIFYLKTKGKKRGYVEKQEHDHNHKGKVPINIIFQELDESDDTE